MDYFHILLFVIQITQCYIYISTKSKRIEVNRCKPKLQKYDKLWDEVEKYELEEKFKSAAETTDKILKRAERYHESAQLVKSFIYKSKFALLLEEDAQQKIVFKIGHILIKASSLQIPYYNRFMQVFWNNT